MSKRVAKRVKETILEPLLEDIDLNLKGKKAQIELTFERRRKSFL
jgi:hypothetical protein